MGVSDIDLDLLLADAVRIATEAGEITLSWFEGRYDIEYKADRSEVTEADRRTESHIRRRLSGVTPEFGIVGEEHGAQMGSGGYTWVVDPIDGTRSFVRGVPLYAVLIGLVRDNDNEPVLGVIHVPPADLVVAAASGVGCFKNGAKTRVSEVAAPSDALVLTTDWADLNRRQPALANRIVGSGAATRTWGDAYGYAMVACGRAEVMIDPIVHPWDIAAVKPVIKEAGGVFSTLGGETAGLGESAVGGNPAIHAFVTGA